MQSIPARRMSSALARHTRRTLPSSFRPISSAASSALSHPAGLDAEGGLAYPRPPFAPGYSQPLPSTHPHYMGEGELTVGITAEEYEGRRKALMDGLEEGAVVIIAGGRLKYLSGQIFYKFRQSSNFWYLTGWEEPDSVLVLEKTSSARGFKMTIFCPSKEATDELWHGPRTGREGAVAIFGADEATDISLLSGRLKSILSVPTNSPASFPIYVDLPGVPASSRVKTRVSRVLSMFDHLVPTVAGQGDFEEVATVLAGQKGRPIHSAATRVERLRSIKSPAEIKVMRKAADISAAAHSKVMRFAQPTSESGLTEHSLVAHFQYHTSLANSPRLAYVPVCASGASGLTIHYTKNNLPLLSGDLVVLDAGCEYGGYASDITRTFPVGGTFLSPQRDLYEAVLRVQRECIKLCTVESGMGLDDLHRKSCDLMRVELKELGFNLKGGELERSLYPHFVGHPLGIDLHDTSSFGRDAKIREGMVITIEPGLIIPPHSNYPSAFHNLSVRVEDEILVRKDDYVVLSVNAPKEVVDIEYTCAHGK